MAEKPANAPATLSGEAETSIIGALLIEEQCVGSVLAAIDASDFVSGTHKATFQAIKRLHLSGKPVDPVTVMDAMQGGPHYVQFIKECMELTPTAANVLEYCAILRDQTRLLRLRELGDQLSRCYDRETAETIMSKANALMVDKRSSRVTTAAEAAQDFVERMRDPVPPSYLTWGLDTLDRTLYAEQGDMILLGGRPSAGKTALSVCMAMHQAHDYRVGYYSLETRTKKLVDRAMATMSQVPLPQIKEREFSATDWERLAQAAVEYSKLKLDHVDAGHMRVQDIVSTALSRRHQIIYVDYMQMIDGSEPKAYERVSRISVELHRAAQEHQIAVVALAQLSRENRNKKGELIPPSMSDFRDSGQIEQDADVALLLWTEDPNDYRSNRVLKIGKNKEGTKGSLTLDFDGPRQTMRELGAKVIAGQTRFSITSEPTPFD